MKLIVKELAIDSNTMEIQGLDPQQIAFEGCLVPDSIILLPSSLIVGVTKVYKLFPKICNFYCII